VTQVDETSEIKLKVMKYLRRKTS